VTFSVLSAATRDERIRPVVVPAHAIARPAMQHRLPPVGLLILILVWLVALARCV
jgi:hypothetical protein